MVITNKMNLPEPFVDAASGEHTYTEGRYSVTEILGGTCEAILKRRHQDEITDDVSNRVWAIFGTAVHRILQDSEETPEQLKENWISVPVGDSGYELSGIFDLYDGSTKTVTDYKTNSVWKVMVGDFEDWRKQLMLYAWMLEQLGFEVHHGKIVSIMRDHSMRKARTEKDYPKHPVMTAHWDFGGKEMIEAEAIVDDWFAEVAQEEALEDENLKPCSPEQRWHGEDKWAVVKDGRKRATKVFGSADEADDFYMEVTGGTGDGYHVEFREGEDTRCEFYCSVAEFCPHYRQMRGATEISG